MDARVAIVGDGTMGTALAAAAASQGRHCLIWSNDLLVVNAINHRHRHSRHFVDRELPGSLCATSDLAHALRSAQLSIVAVESSTFREVARRMSVHVSPALIVLSATKGLEPMTGKRMSQILGEEIPSCVSGAISGPNIARDIIDELPTGVLVASGSDDAPSAATKLIGHPSLHVYGSLDLVGVELLGALKNVVVIAAGIAAGLNLGDNARALIVTFGLMEIQKLASSFGAQENASFGLAGFGDLFLSITSTHSRNHSVGVKIGCHVKLSHILEELRQANETAEGINTIRECVRVARTQGVDMPLAECVYKIVFGQRPPKACLEQFFRDAAPLRRYVA